MLVRNEVRYERERKLYRADFERPPARDISSANRFTAIMLNALAIGAISAAFIAPDGSFSEFSGIFRPDGGSEHLLSGWRLDLSGETRALQGPDFLKFLEPVLPVFYIVTGFLLHIAAREIAKRS